MAGGYNFPEDDRLDRIIKALNDRIASLEKLTRANSTSIDDGALEIKQNGVTVLRVGQTTDGTYGIEILSGGAMTVFQGGTKKVKVGLLDNGTYGLALYDTAGNAFPLSQLAFGPKVRKNDGAITPFRNTWVDDAALSMTTEVTTGRLIVMLSAQINAGSGGTGTRSEGLYGYRLAGPNGFFLPPNFGRSYYHEYAGVGMESMGQGTWVDVQEGLPLGNYTIVPTMYSGSEGNPPNDATFAYRRITVLPY